MKKILSLLICFISLFCFSSCNLVNEKRLEEALDSFFSSESISADCLIYLEEGNNIIQTELFSFKHALGSFELDINQLDAFFGFYSGGRSVYLCYSNENTNKKIYTKFEFAISPTSLTISSTEEKDIKDYLTNIVYGKNKINCNFDITSMLIDLLGPIEGLPQELNIQLEMNVNENVVNEVIFDFTSLINIGTSENKISKAKIILKNIEYEHFTLTPFDSRQYENHSLETFLSYVEFDLTKEDSDGNSSTNEYSFSLSEKYYYLDIGDSLDINGLIYNNGIACDDLSNYQISYTPELDLEKIGETKYEVSIVVKGHVLKDTITVCVADRIKSTDVIDIGTNIVKSFEFGDYLLVADSDKLYKVNLSSHEIEGEVNLKCVARDICVKDNYLYVTANYTPLAGVSDKKKNLGTISKIDLTTFTISEQIDVDYPPYSIIVDKRGTVIVSKDSGSTSSIFGIIDFKNKTSTDFLVQNGENYAYLIYKEDKDAFISITQKSTSENRWHFFEEGVGYNSQGTKAKGGINFVLYKSLDDNKIISNVDGEGFKFIKYNSNTMEYKMKKYQFYNIPNSFYISPNDDIPYAIDGNIVYALIIRGYNREDGCLLIFDTEQETQIYKEIKLERNVLSQIFIYEDKLFVQYKNLEKIYIYDI